MGRIPVAAQVYSVRDEAEADFEKTMHRLAQMGYDGVELAGMYGKSAEEIDAVLKKEGLAAISAHVPVEEFEKDMEGTLDAYASLGCRWLAIPWLSEERRFGAGRYQETLALIRAVSEGCRQRGMRLLYHNHDFEFQKTPEGVYHLDQLYADVPEEVLGAEPDLCWVKVGGEDPCAFLKRYAGRCPVLHMKDFRRTDAGAELVCLGDGELGVKEVLEAGIAGGAQWIVIEQDDHPYGEPMADMEKSLRFLERCEKD